MYSGVPIGTLTVLYVIWTLVGAPENKKYILLFFGIISAIFYISLYTTFPYSVITNAPLQQCELYDDWLNPLSILYYMEWVMSFIPAIIGAIGFNKLIKKSSGEVKKKAQSVQIATSFYSLGVLAEFVILGPLISFPEYFVWIARISVIIGAILIHRAFKLKKN